MIGEREPTEGSPSYSTDELKNRYYTLYPHEIVSLSPGRTLSVPRDATSSQCCRWGREEGGEHGQNNFSINSCQLCSFVSLTQSDRSRDNRDQNHESALYITHLSCDGLMLEISWMDVAEEDVGVSAWSSVVASCTDDSNSLAAKISADCPSSWALQIYWVKPTGCVRCAGQVTPTRPSTVNSSRQYGSKSNIKGNNDMDYFSRCFGSLTKQTKLNKPVSSSVG